MPTVLPICIVKPRDMEQHLCEHELTATSDLDENVKFCFPLTASDNISSYFTFRSCTLRIPLIRRSKFYTPYKMLLGRSWSDDPPHVADCWGATDHLLFLFLFFFFCGSLWRRWGKRWEEHSGEPSSSHNRQAIWMCPHIRIWTWFLISDSELSLSLDLDFSPKLKLRTDFDLDLNLISGLESEFESESWIWTSIWIWIGFHP